jgi:glutamine synthetase
MEDMGWGPYQADHEDANGQFEINWDYDNALVTADRMTLFKYMVRSLAEAKGMRATFMPKPFQQLTGNGAHVHLSLHDVKTGANVFGGGSPDVHGLNEMALSFLGGIMAHAPAAAALTNPTINSYKRINASTTSSGATWSPNAVAWSGNNRTTFVRVPGEGERVELRAADMSANPYLLPAAYAASGMAGLEANGGAPEPVNCNMYDSLCPTAQLAREQAVKLPSTLNEALDNFADSVIFRQYLGNDFVNSYVKLRRQHVDQFQSQVSAWELQQYLDC